MSAPALRLVEDGEQAPARESKASTGAPGSFEVAFRQHYALVAQMLRSYGVDAAHVDDVAQEVFLVVHRRWEDYDGRAAFTRWLVGICRRTASDWRRGRSRARGRKQGHPGFARSQTGTDAQVEARREVQLVESILATLPEAQREVLVMSDVLGMTGPEISEALGVKLATVYSRLRLARATFEQRMARHDDEPGGARS